MSKQHLSVIKGGQEACASTFEMELGRLHAELVQASAPLQEKVEALETDWNTRPGEFWQEMLTALPVLQAAIQPAIEHTLGRELFPCGIPHSFLRIRYEVLGALYNAKKLIDDVGIAVTSYQSVCQSRTVAHLHQRQHALKTLRTLVEQVRTALDLMGRFQSKPLGEEEKHE